MVRRQRQERGAEQRVRPRREDLDRARPARRSAKKTRAPSERPIQFSCISRTRSGQRSSVVERVEQLFGERGDAQEPLRQEPLFDDRAGAPAAPVDHLLVGQDGVLDRVPVDPGFLAIGEPGREEVEKHLLLVPVIFRMAGRDLARPVIGEPHALQLRRASSRCSRGSRSPDGCCRRSPRSRPAARTRPSPSGAAH